MGKSPDELRQEIAEVRGDLGYKLDAIGDRVSPGRIYERKTERVRGGLSRAKERVMGSADQLHGSTTDMAYSGRDAVGSATGTVSSADGRAGGTVGSAASSASDAVGSGVSTLVGGVRSAPDAAKAQAQGNPMAAGIIAFGAGLLLSSLLPASQAEQRAAVALKEKAEPLTETAKQAVGEIQSAMSDTAMESVATVKEAASVAAGEVADHASSATQHVTEEAKSAGQDVAQQAKGAGQTVAEESKGAAREVRPS